MNQHPIIIDPELAIKIGYEAAAFKSCLNDIIMSAGSLFYSDFNFKEAVDTKELIQQNGYWWIQIPINFLEKRTGFTVKKQKELIKKIQVNILTTTKPFSMYINCGRV